MRRVVSLLIVASGCLGAPPGQHEVFWGPHTDPGEAGFPTAMTSADAGSPAPPATVVDAASGPAPTPPASAPDAQPAPAGDPTPTAMGCALQVTVTTVVPNSGYSPRNVGAIWIEDGAGKFVKTLDVWAARRARHLTAWSAVTAAAGVPRDETDAISGATQEQGGPQTARWNCTDYMHRPAPDGPYQLCLELTSDNATGPMSCTSFTKGKAPFSTKPTDTPTFTRRSLTFSP